ncbi:MAG: hypothetical protein HGA45_22195 [Chloroflexales bacterium]|nr:hypothetical protein [Chloroflexales bacterium]
MAGLTFFISAGRYDLDASGAPIPGSYHRVEPNPQRLRDAVLAPIDGMNGFQAEDGSVDRFATGIASGFAGIPLGDGIITGGLAIGRAPIATWWRFVLPLVGMLAVMIMAMAVLAVGVFIGA